LPSAFHPAPFQIDHIIARQHGGKAELENLALSCIHCNRFKGPNVAGVDPDTKRWPDQCRSVERRRAVLEGAPVALQANIKSDVAVKSMAGSTVA